MKKNIYLTFIFVIVLCVCLCSCQQGNELNIDSIDGYSCTINKTDKIVILEISDNISEIPLNALIVSDGITISAYKDIERKETVTAFHISKNVSYYYLTLKSKKTTSEWVLILEKKITSSNPIKETEEEKKDLPKEISNVTIESFKSTYYLGEVFLDGVLCATYSNGEKENKPITIDMLTTFNTTKTGTFNTNINYSGYACPVAISVIKKTVPVASTPEKTNLLKEDYYSYIAKAIAFSKTYKTSGYDFKYYYNFALMTLNAKNNDFNKSIDIIFEMLMNSGVTDEEVKTLFANVEALYTLVANITVNADNVAYLTSNELFVNVKTAVKSFKSAFTSTKLGYLLAGIMANIHFDNPFLSYVNMTYEDIINDAKDQGYNEVASVLEEQKSGYANNIYNIFANFISESEIVYIIDWLFVIIDKIDIVSYENLINCINIFFSFSNDEGNFDSYKLFSASSLYQYASFLKKFFEITDGSVDAHVLNDICYNIIQKNFPIQYRTKYKIISDFIVGAVNNSHFLSLFFGGLNISHIDTLLNAIKVESETNEQNTAAMVICMADIFNNAFSQLSIQDKQKLEIFLGDVIMFITGKSYDGNILIGYAMQACSYGDFETLNQEEVSSLLKIINNFKSIFSSNDTHSIIFNDEVLIIEQYTTSEQLATLLNCNKLILKNNGNSLDYLFINSSNISNYKYDCCGTQSILITYNSNDIEVQKEVPLYLYNDNSKHDFVLANIDLDKAFNMTKDTEDITEDDNSTNPNINFKITFIDVKNMFYYTISNESMTFIEVKNYNENEPGLHIAYYIYNDILLGDIIIPFQYNIPQENNPILTAIQFEIIKVYIIGEDTNTTLGSIALFYDYSTQSSEYANITLEMLSGFDPTTPGYQEVNIQYGQFCYTTMIEVITLEQSLEIVSLDVELTKYYCQYDIFDENKLNINLELRYGSRYFCSIAECNDFLTSINYPQFVFENFDSTKSGEIFIHFSIGTNVFTIKTVIYTEKQGFIPIALINVSIILNNKLDDDTFYYSVGDFSLLHDGILELKLINGSNVKCTFQEAVDKYSLSITDWDPFKPGFQNITLRILDQTVTYQVFYYCINYIEIKKGDSLYKRIHSLSEELSINLYFGETFDFNDMTYSVIYNHQKFDKIGFTLDESIIIGDYDINVPNIYSLIMQLAPGDIFIKLKIMNKTIEDSISIIECGVNNKLHFPLGDFSLLDLGYVVLLYNDGNTETLTLANAIEQYELVILNWDCYIHGLQEPTLLLEKSKINLPGIYYYYQSEIENAKIQSIIVSVDNYSETLIPGDENGVLIIHTSTDETITTDVSLEDLLTFDVYYDFYYINELDCTLNENMINGYYDLTAIGLYNITLDLPLGIINIQLYVE